MSDARSVRNFGIERLQSNDTIVAYEVIQTPSGKAGVLNSPLPVASGEFPDLYTSGEWTLTKTGGFVALKGLRAYWDHSANAVNYKRVNDRDFYLGRFADDYLSSAVSCNVLLNEDPPYDIDIRRDPVRSAIVGTQGLNTMGVFPRGGASKFIHSVTNEAQKLDILSKDGFSIGCKGIIEIAWEVVDDGAGTAVDVSLGIASGTHATNASSITDRLFVHFDANDVNVNAESSDGTTTVALVDTLFDYVVGSRHEAWFDLRNSADVQIYIDGVNYLPGTAFNLAASAAVWKLLAHAEKTAAADVYELDIEWMRMQSRQQ